MGISVCPQPGQDPSVHQLHGGRAAACISHIGLRVMYDHGACLFDQVHLVGIDVDAVPEQRLFSQDPVIHQPVHDPFPVMLQAVVEILDPLRHMDVVSHFIGLVRRRKLKGLIRDRKLRVHAHHARDHPALIFQRMPDKLRVLHHGRPRLVHAVPV